MRRSHMEVEMKQEIDVDLKTKGTKAKVTIK
jgi:hypothetical protein